MKKIKLQEFTQHIDKYIEEQQPLALEKNEQVLGFYYPQTEGKKIEALWELLNQTVAKMAQDSDIDSETLINTLDPCHPFSV